VACVGGIGKGFEGVKTGTEVLLLLGIEDEIVD